MLQQTLLRWDPAYLGSRMPMVGDIANSRFETAKAAQMTRLAEVPGLKLKWAFGLFGRKQVFGSNPRW